MRRETYKDKKIPSCNCNRTIKEEAKEIKDRLMAFYMKTDMSFDYDTPHESQVYPLVQDFIDKILNEDCVLVSNSEVKEEWNSESF